MRRLLAVLALAGGLSAPALGMGASARGTSAAAFLKLPAGARPGAMGDAFGAVADDPNAAAYNPAGLAFIKRVSAVATHDSHFQSLRHDFGSVAVPLLSLTDTREQRNAWGVAALSVRTLGATGIERRGLVETDQPVGTFAAEDYAYAASYGRVVSGGFAAGATLKLVSQSLDSAQGKAEALDAGMLWRGRGLTFGAGWRNLGTPLKLGGVASPLPFTPYAAGSWAPAGGLLAVWEVRLPRDDSPRFSVGGELTRSFGRLGAALRGGWNSSDTAADGLGGLTLGGGVSLGGFGVDFGWLPYGDLGAAYVTSVRLSF
ncbi:MAG: PorV/PorQ family protein [Elusimicrobia bacterium]|nr:PorV/PorQ family protein [Elusimicrobiota bacterium]